MSGLFLGKICEVKAEDKSLVRVDYLGVISPFLPYLQTANAFKRHFTPPRVGEQVILLDFGGFKGAIGGFFNKNYPEPPSASASKEIISYEDGTIISYDTSNSTLEILNPKTINIICQNEINVTAKSANITAPNVHIKGNVAIEGNISAAGAGGGAGKVEIKGDVRISGNLKTAGNITDARGDLTGHGHNDTDGGTSLPR